MAVKCLHAISVGFPVVGDTVFMPAEKFLNPTVHIPEDVYPLLLKPWVDSTGTILRDTSTFMEYLLDPITGLNENQSKLLHSTRADEDYTSEGEGSHCRYVDHPESVLIRRDRGRIHTKTSS
jgi:hypothetical protein